MCSVTVTTLTGGGSIDTTGPPLRSVACRPEEKRIPVAAASFDGIRNSGNLLSYSSLRLLSALAARGVSESRQKGLVCAA